MPHAVFITGTDTGVGKTVVTAALCRCLARRGWSVGVMKPIETGIPSPAAAVSDAVHLRDASETESELALIRPYWFRIPVAPLTAARLAKKRIVIDRIIAAFHVLCRQHALLLVEGVGGVHVPLTDSQDVLDLIKALHVATIVVGRSKLGGINHARLTIEALHKRHIRVLALVLSRTEQSGRTESRQERSTVTLLREFAQVPVIGPVPYDKNLNQDWNTAVKRLSFTAAIEDLADVLVGSLPADHARLSLRPPLPGRLRSRRPHRPRPA
jgi:dethiobiotin synthetase